MIVRYKFREIQSAGSCYAIEAFKGNAYNVNTIITLAIAIIIDIGYIICEVDTILLVGSLGNR